MSPVGVGSTASGPSHWGQAIGTLGSAPAAGTPSAGDAEPAGAAAPSAAAEGSMNDRCVPQSAH